MWWGEHQPLSFPSRLARNCDLGSVHSKFWHTKFVFYDLGLEDCSGPLTKLVLIKKWYEIFGLYTVVCNVSTCVTVIWISLRYIESWVWAFWLYTRSRFGEDTSEWSLATSPERHYAVCVMLQYLSLCVLISKCYNKIRVSKLDLPYLSAPTSSSWNAICDWWLRSIDHNKSAKGSVEDLILKTLFCQCTVSWLKKKKT